MSLHSTESQHIPGGGVDLWDGERRADHDGHLGVLWGDVRDEREADPEDGLQT